MSDPYLGQLLFSGFPYAPRGYAACDGQLLPIPQNAALFSLLGTMYGGDGRSTFALPDLRGRTPIGGFRSSAERGRETQPIGAVLGSETVTLLSAQLPVHTHSLNAIAAPGTSPGPTAATFAGAGSAVYSTDPSSLVPLGATPAGPAGGGQSHPNLQPFGVIAVAIALTGVFPPRP